MLAVHVLALHLYAADGDLNEIIEPHPIEMISFNAGHSNNTRHRKGDQNKSDKPLHSIGIGNIKFYTKRNSTVLNFLHRTSIFIYIYVFELKSSHQNCTR